MKLQRVRITMFVLIGVLFLSISSVYAETAEEHFNRGSDENYELSYDEEISEFTKAIELNPNYAEAYCSRGAVYSCKHDLDRAIADYTKAIEIDPNNPYYYEARYLAYYSKKDYDSAWNDVHKAQSLGKTSIISLDEFKKASGREN